MLQSNKQMALFHVNIRWILVMAQIFGLLPVRGVTSHKLENLVFTWCSKRVALALVVIIGSTFTMVMSLYRIFLVGYTLHRMSEFVFIY